jgi:hypothetical protein
LLRFFEDIIRHLRYLIGLVEILLMLRAVSSKALPLLSCLVDISRAIRVIAVILISAQWLELSLDSSRRGVDIFKESRVAPSVVAQPRIQGFPRDHA